MKRWKVGFAVLVGLVGASNTCCAAILFSESFTGAELAADPRVSFPTRTPVVDGSSLIFDGLPAGDDSLQNQILLVLPLVPGNTLSLADPTVVTISMRYTRQAGTYHPYDHDPQTGVGDGSYIVNFITADNFNGSAGPGLYRDLGTRGQEVSKPPMLSDVGYPAIGQAFEVQASFTLFESSTEVYGAFGGQSGSLTFGKALDRGDPLSFVFMAHDWYEKYRIESASIEVRGTAIPEPASVFLWSAFGAIGLIAAWRRRKRQAP